MERIDDLQRGGLKIIQDTDTFCFGIDAVLLSDFAFAKPGERVMDLCAGNGVVSLLMYARYNAASYTALEIQKPIADMALASVKMNHLENRIAVINGDVREAKTLFPSGSFDVVTANPPYINNQGRQNEKEALRVARHEVLLSLPELLRSAAYLLTFRGRFYMIHRAQRLPEIIGEMLKVGLQPKAIRLVHPFVDKMAQQVLIEASLGGGEGALIKAPLIVYKEPGVYTDEILGIYNMLPQE